jgi:predicted nucleic acid-binding protein
VIYVDTSVIVKLYFKEEYSREASSWLKENNEAMRLTSFHGLSIVYRPVKLCSICRIRDAQ